MAEKVNQYHRRGQTITGLDYLNQILCGGRTNPSDELPETVSFPSVEALFAILAGREALVALALIGASVVHASAVLTDIRVYRALVDVLTVVGHTDLKQKSIDCT